MEIFLSLFFFTGKVGLYSDIYTYGEYLNCAVQKLKTRNPKRTNLTNTRTLKPP